MDVSIRSHTMKIMRPDLPFTRCLLHQLPEDQATPLGLVCVHCKQRLYTRPPQGRCLSCWESQPEAYSLDGRPCFVFTLIWDDYRIRSLHPPGSDEDARGARVRAAAGRGGGVVPLACDFDEPDSDEDGCWFGDSEFELGEP